MFVQYWVDQLVAKYMGNGSTADWMQDTVPLSEVPSDVRGATAVAADRAASLASSMAGAWRGWLKIRLCLNGEWFCEWGEDRALGAGKVRWQAWCEAARLQEAMQKWALWEGRCCFLLVSASGAILGLFPTLTQESAAVNA